MPDCWKMFPFCFGSQGPKGLRAESARAVTTAITVADGALTVGRGKTFWHVNRFFFMKTAVTLERKVENSFPRWEMNGLSKGYKRAFDQNWGHMANIKFFGKNRDLRPKKSPLKMHFLPKKHFSADRKNARFSVILARIGSVVILGHFFDGPDSPTTHPP